MSESVHGVGGDALGGVDGGGVAETGRLADVVGGQPDGEPAAVVSDREVAVPADAVMVQRSPFLTQSVAVRRSRRSLLRVMITSPALAWFPSASRTSACRQVAVEAVVAGAAVEFGDQLAGGGEHDRVQPRRPVRSPSGERILGGGGDVADVNTAVIEVEPERLGFAVAEGERCRGFGGVGEAVQLGQLEGAVGVFDVAEDAAGADRGELLIITDQPDTPTATDGELRRRCRGRGCRPCRLRR